MYFWFKPLTVFMIIYTNAYIFYFSFLGSDGYLFSCLPGMLIRIVSLIKFYLASQVLLGKLFNCFHNNLHKVHVFLTLVFLV